MSALLALAAATSQPSGWKVELIWGCAFTEKGRDSYVVQGRLFSRPHPNLEAEPEQAMHVLKDESRRLEGYVARSPYYVNPRPGEHWIMPTTPNEVGLILHFPPGAESGRAELMLRNVKEPAAVGKCEFKEADA